MSGSGDLPTADDGNIALEVSDLLYAETQEPLTRLLQLVAICFRTIKSWSGFADDLWWRSSKCSANNDILKFFLLLKY